eukprot:14261256-Heterocapsa_arctica.AAC.1
MASPCALEHRITAAQQHFYARAPELTCRRVSLKRRIQRLYSTVHKSLLHGAGGWTLSKGLLARCESFELSNMRRLLQTPKLPDE